MGLRPTQGDESGSCSATTVAGSAALPFVISTGAQRSGEICGLLFQQPSQRPTAALPFVISTGAQRSGEICVLPLP